MRFIDFFFKLNTADQLRIRDWSSDVCSSDLAVRAGMAGNAAAEERELQWNLLIHPRIALRQFPQRGYIAGLSHKGEAAALLQFIDNGGKRRRSSIADRKSVV